MVGALAFVGLIVLVAVLVVAKGWLGDKVDDLAKERQEVVDETGIETGSTDVDHPPRTRHPPGGLRVRRRGRGPGVGHAHQLDRLAQ